MLTDFGIQHRLRSCGLWNALIMRERGNWDLDALSVDYYFTGISSLKTSDAKYFLGQFSLKHVSKTFLIGWLLIVTESPIMFLVIQTFCKQELHKECCKKTFQCCKLKAVDQHVLGLKHSLFHLPKLPKKPETFKSDQNDIS